MGTVVEPDRKSAPATGRLAEEDLLSALPARSTNREVRVGIFVLVGIAAFLTLLFTMTDVGTFRGRYYVNTVVESAGGMRRGDAVQMRGVNIGRVIGFDMVPEGVNVRMEVSDEYPIPEGSHVEVRSAGIMGGMVVDVVPGPSEERVEDGTTLPGASSEDVFAQAAGLGVRADTVLTRVNMLLSEQNVNAIGTSTTELQTLLAELNAIANQQRAQLLALTSTLQRSAAGVEAITTSPELQRSVQSSAQNLDSLTAQLILTSRTLGQATTSLQTVASRLESGEGSLGKAMRDEQLYDNLNTTVTNLNSLITDIQTNPRKYINLEVF